MSVLNSDGGASQLGCTEEQLREAVRVVGTSAAAVRKSAAIIRGFIEKTRPAKEEAGREHSGNAHR